MMILPENDWKFAGRLIFVCAVIPAVLCGQSPAFEVASIRPNPSPPLMGVAPHMKGGLFIGEAMTLTSLVTLAYGIGGGPDRVLGPDWLEKDRYDIAARAPAGVPDSELKPMLQSLLRDRFKLSAHIETRERPLYELVIAPGGVKMVRNPADLHATRYKKASGISVFAQRMTMERLADTLSNLMMGKTVVDKTGLTGTFAISFQTSALIPGEGNTSDPGDDAPDVFRAVEEQLGLKLQSTKGDLDVLVVDHIERTPTDN
jgi:uncharacterized protein (TIGR03435 family)